MFTSDNYATLRKQLTELAKLYINNAKLTACEKAVKLFAGIAICSAVFLLSVVALFFFSIAAVHWIAQGTGTDWAYLIMGGVYVMIMAALVVFKRTLVIKPLSRFLSKLLLS